MNLAGTSLYTAVSTAITLISGFVITKIVSVQIGPEGLAYLGQFQNITSIVSMVASGAIGVGIIKYLAEYNDSPGERQNIITTALYIILVLSCLTSIFVIINSKWFSMISFHHTGLQPVYLLYGIFLMIISVNTWFAAVFNGLKEIRKLTLVNSISAVAGIFFTVYFAKSLGVTGVLIAGNFTALTALLVNIYFSRQLKSIIWKPSLPHLDRRLLPLFFGFTLMSVTAILTSACSQLLIREKIITTLSLSEAGIWQGITRLSDYYLGFIVTVLSVYYLPRLSELREKDELRFEILKGYRLILPVMIMMAVLIFLLRGFIVQLLFTQQFHGMIPLFKFQLMGDVLKIGSWVIAFIMLAKRLVTIFVITEIIFAASYVLLSFLFIGKFGVVGSTYAFCLNYGFYWLVMAVLMRKYLR
ncbi:MAG: O-antigen translocase [Ginsengibacter sp.]